MRKPIKSESPFIQAMRKKFGTSSYTLLTQVEVPFGSGFQFVDAMLLGKRPSFDLSIQGFEIKSTRANWLQEMSNPSKSEGGFFYCDGWSLLTYPGMADPQEIPPFWGHWVLDGYNLVELKAAPALQPKPFDRSFVARICASLISQAAENVDLLSSEAEFNRGFSAGKAAGYKEAEESQGYIESRLAQQTLQIERLNSIIRVSGLNGFTQEEIDIAKKASTYFKKYGLRMHEAIAAIEVFANAGPKKLKEDLEGLYEKACDIKNRIEKHLRVIPAIDSGAEKNEEGER